jgi:two-component system response regulator DesR
VIRLLLAEDQTMMRGALIALLNLEPDFDVVAEVADGLLILPEAIRTRPAVALLDIEMPGRSGLHAAADIAEQLPGCHVVIVTTFARPGYVQRAMAAGAKGFIAKDGPVEHLVDAVRRVASGSMVIDPELARSALRHATNPLADRERQVLVAAEGGSTIADIAGQLHLSTSTVRNYLSSAIGKTGTRNKVEAALLARAQGWL